jgi:hypothetical protein
MHVSLTRLVQTSNNYTSRRKHKVQHAYHFSTRDCTSKSEEKLVSLPTALPPKSAQKAQQSGVMAWLAQEASWWLKHEL